MAFGVEILNDLDQLEVRDVTYDSGVYISAAESQMDDADTVALKILTQKQIAWEREREVRVFSPTTSVPIQLKELVLGLRVSSADQDLTTAVARKWHPEITITKIDKDSLDHPDAV